MSRNNSILYLDGVSVSFDGFRAINNLSFVVDKGEMRAIIGPNGAGKTTMMDIVTGKTRPDEGEVFFDGEIDLTKHDEAEIAMMGIGRKFQKPTVFESHTVEDNLVLALKGPRSIFPALFHRRSASRDARASTRSSASSGSATSAHMLAANLSHGQKQWLEIGMLLAQDPEAAAGRRAGRRHDRRRDRRDGAAAEGHRDRPIRSSWSSTTCISCANSASR